jgi:hypothetical protein
MGSRPAGRADSGGLCAEGRDRASDAAGGGPFTPVPASSAGGRGDRASLPAWDRLACPARADRAVAVGVEGTGAVQRRGRVGQDADRRGTSVSSEPTDRQRRRKRRVARERSVTIATSIKAATPSNALSSSNKGEDGVQARQAGHALLWRRGPGCHPHLVTDGEATPKTHPGSVVSSRPCAVMEVNHAIAETTLVQQFERHADIVREELYAASHHDGHDEQVALVD